MMLFYRVATDTPRDSDLSIDGIDCRLWRDEYVGMHSRDLYRLADLLDSGGLSNTLKI